MASDDEEALIARLRIAFEENIKSRSAVAKIRGNIAAKVGSYISFNGQSKGVPATLNPLGKEISGLRRKYLEALKTNIEVRERNQLASHGTRYQQSFRSEGQLLPQHAVFFNLELFRLEQRHQELNIHRRYASTLSQDALALCNLDIPSLEQRTDVSNVDGSGEGIVAAVGEVKALTLKLRKAALQANNQLERQKLLLAQAKQMQATQYSRKSEEDGRPRAIARTRDTLVVWLDEKLSASTAELAEELIGRSVGQVSQSGPSLTEHYQRYLSARSEVIEAGTEASRQLSRFPSEGPGNPAVSSTEQPSLDSLYLVHAIRQRVVPLLQQRLDNMMLQLYSSAELANERKRTIDVLERLADESHLLSTYPTNYVDNVDALERNVAAWISAANTSSASAAEAIDQQYKEGLQALENCEAGLVELRSYLDKYESPPSKDEGTD